MSVVVAACGVVVLGAFEAFTRQKHQAQALEVVPGELVEGKGTDWA